MHFASALLEAPRIFTGNSLVLVLLVTATLGTLAAYVTGRLIFDRRRLSIRILSDSPLTVSLPDLPSGSETVIHKGHQIHDASLVLLRVANTGSGPIDRHDIDHALRFRFPGRAIVGVEVPSAHPNVLRTIIFDQLKRDDLVDMSESELVVPRIPLNRRENFTLLVLLSGKETGVQVRGLLRGGRIVWETHSRRLSRLALPGLAVVLTAAVLAFSISIVDFDFLSPPTYCTTESLEILVSSGVSSVLEEVVDDYRRACSTTEVQLTASGSSVGVLRDLDLRAVPNAADVLAVSERISHNDLASLQAHPIFVVPFAVVLNDSTGISAITLDQLKMIFLGQVTNWQDIGGSDLPIRIVSRGPDSGTRQVFEEKLLGSAEVSLSSNDCSDRRYEAPHVRCERGSTEDVLRQVKNTSGAIGYAGVSDAREARVPIATIDGNAPSFATIRSGSYPFWAVAYAYTIGAPTPSSPSAAFLEYLSLDEVKILLEGKGYIPCDGGTAPC
jgi:phosphate transport system substrate-binding protein